MLEAKLRKYNLTSMLKKFNRIGSSNNQMGTFNKKISGKGEGYLQIFYPRLMGRFHLDLQPVIIKNFRLKAYTLKSVTTKFLATTKIDLPFDCNHLKPCTVLECKTQKGLYALKTPEAFAEIGEYCVVDSELCISLEIKLNVIGSQIEFANVVYFPLEHLFTSGEMKKIGAQIFVNGYELGFLFEDKPYVENQVVESGKKYQGARVLEPLKGAYMENILTVLDFASLYPSIMIRFNICPSTCCIVKPPKNQRHHYKEVQLDDGGEKVWVHQKTDGVLPVILQNLWCERKRIRKEMELIVKDTAEGAAVLGLLDAKQKAIKVSMNSIYGIFGASVGDLSFMELSRAVCAIGRSMLDEVEESIKTNHKDMQVVYGDSVSASTCIVVRGRDGCTRSLSIETFWDEMAEAPTGYRGDKEVFHFNIDGSVVLPIFEIYSEKGWTSINKIIRHNPQSTRMYKIRINNGSVVEVTGDHSLLLACGTCITPADLKVGDVLLTKKFEGNGAVGQLDKNTFVGAPDFSQDVGENEIHLFDLYHCQLMIQYLGPLFVKVTVSGQTYKILYNCSLNDQDGEPDGEVTHVTRYTCDKGDWVYDLETVNHHFSAGLGTIVVHNTDSVFVKLPTFDEKAAFEMATNLAVELTTQLFQAPVLLEFEKIYKGFILFKKKNYVGMKLEHFGGKYAIEDKGLISVQRTTPICVARIYQQVIDNLFHENNPFAIYEMTKAYIEKMLDGETSFLDFVQSTRLKDDYVNPLAIPHARVAMAVNNRAGTEIYSNGDRVQYVRYCPPGLCPFEIDALGVAEKVEDPNFILSRGYKINYRSYLQQMEKAFLELAFFFPEVYKLEQALFNASLNDSRVHDGLVKVRGTGKTRMVNGVAEKSKPLKKRKISSYFLPRSKENK